MTRSAQNCVTVVTLICPTLSWEWKTNCFIIIFVKFLILLSEVFVELPEQSLHFFLFFSVFLYLFVRWCLSRVMSWVRFSLKEKKMFSLHPSKRGNKTMRKYINCPSLAALCALQCSGSFWEFYAKCQEIQLINCSYFIIFFYKYKLLFHCFALLWILSHM